MVPGGGPALDGERWITSHHPTEHWRRKPFLVDHVQLGRCFRQHFVAGLRRLIRQGKLRLEQEWSKLQDATQRDTWLDELLASEWNVFIQGAPKENSDPQQVLKYLARYLTGGPISNRRIVRDEAGMVTFKARSKEKRRVHPTREVSLSGHEFLRRWSLHILPKGFTKTRCYGGYHGTVRATYLEQCRGWLSPTALPPDEAAGPDQCSEPKAPQPSEATLPKCPRCQSPMECIQAHARPSWKEVFHRRSYATRNMVLLVHGIGQHYVPDD